MSFTILLVEDDLDVREALAETLREEGYAVDCATDGSKRSTTCGAAAVPG